ncbi:MAG: hypothetical protein ACRCUI_02605, partial [Polymorphobacter sp.]
WRRPMDLAYWRRAFDWEKSGGIDSWDYQWILTLWRHRALCVRPTMNLVENIGFGADATHTTATNSPLANLPVYAGDGGFSAGPAVLAADERRDAVDRREWLRLSWKTLTAIYLPVVARLGKRLAA